MQNYTNLLQELLEKGREKEDRTGTGTLSLFGKHLEWDLSAGFPLLTLKKLSFKNIVTELLWFLKGKQDLAYLLQHNNRIWVGDAYKRYKLKKSPIAPLLTEEEFCQKILDPGEYIFRTMWGNMGRIYGPQWRAYGDPNVGGPFDQIEELLENLKNTPDSRRLLVTAWNPLELDRAILPPCHIGFQVDTALLSDSERVAHYLKGGGIPHDHLLEHLNQINYPSREINLSYSMRSNDFFLGAPYNIASYALLLHLLGHFTNMIPKRLVAQLGDVHLYKNHIDQAKELIRRGEWEVQPSLPKLKLVIPNDILTLEDLEWEHFALEGYCPLSAIPAPLSN